MYHRRNRNFLMSRLSVSPFSRQFPYFIYLKLSWITMNSTDHHFFTFFQCYRSRAAQALILNYQLVSNQDFYSHFLLFVGSLCTLLWYLQSAVTLQTIIGYILLRLSKYIRITYNYLFIFQNIIYYLYI